MSVVNRDEKQVKNSTVLELSVVERLMMSSLTFKILIDDDENKDGSSRLVRTDVPCIPSDSESPDPILSPVIIVSTKFPDAASGGGISCSSQFPHSGRKRLPRLDLLRLDRLVANLDQRCTTPLPKSR